MSKREQSTPVEFHLPTPEEIDAHVVHARKLRAQTIAAGMKSALQWISGRDAEPVAKSSASAKGSA